ncbi:MAG TPA: hypothetical protein VJS20_07495 [Gemmatimonadales bacterium]|nr:hypothetical protein [Gemmatimonadales bacterium]
MNRLARWTVFVASAGLSACGSPSYVIVHNPVVTVRITPALDTIPFGGSVALTLTTLDVNGDPTIPDHLPVWTSLNTAVFVVDSVGNVSAHWYGQGTIRAIVDGVEGDAIIVARPPRVIKVSISSQAARAERGDTVLFHATATNEAQLQVPTTGAQWSASDTTKLRIDSTGRGVAVGVGGVTVRVTFAGLSDSTAETVLVPAASVTLSPDSLAVPFGAIDSFQVTVRDSAGNILTDHLATVVTTSVVQAAPVIAPPSSYLVVRGVTAGPGIVTVTAGHVRDSATVTVGAQHLITFTAAVAGGAFTCGLDVDSAAYCWGSGQGGELGTGDAVTGPQPRPVAGGLKFTTLTAGPNFACGLIGGGTAYCWGSNTTQQLGTAGGSTSVPAAVSGSHQYTAIDAHFSFLGDTTEGGVCAIAVGGQVYCWGSGWGATPVAVGTPGFVDQLALGALGYCGNHSADTAAYCWSPGSAPARLDGWDSLPLSLEGRGAWGAECGISRTTLYCGGNWPATSTSTTDMILSPSSPVTTNVVEAATGVHHGCVKSSGIIYCRGDNTVGELGSTTGVTFIGNWLGIASPPPSPAGLTAGWSHTCVFGSDGLLYCWGDNSFGQAGSSTPVMVSVPQAVLGQAGTP